MRIRRVTASNSPARTPFPWFKSTKEADEPPSTYARQGVCRRDSGKFSLRVAPDDKKVYSVLDLCAPETAQAIIEPLLRTHTGEDQGR